jgi:YVTN family beta-propeller protein
MQVVACADSMRLLPPPGMRLVAIVSALALVPIAAVPAIASPAASLHPPGTTLESTVAVGAQPDALAFDPANGDVYVVDSYYASYSGGSVSVIDPATDALVKTVAVGDHPVAIAFDAADGDLYVADAGAAEVTVIDGATNAVKTTIKVGNIPQAVAYDATNRNIYVANSQDGTVSVIKGSGNKVVATVTVGKVPLSLTIDTADGDIFVANRASNTISVISGSTESVGTTTTVGPQPIASAFDSSDGDLYVLDANEAGLGSVSVLDGSTGAVLASPEVGVFPDAVAYDPENKDVYVANLGGTTVSVIDGARQTVTASVTVGDYPDALLYDPDDSDVYAADYGTDAVAAINSDTNTVSGTITVGDAPAAFAYDTTTDTVLVTNYASANVDLVSGHTAPTTLLARTRHAQGNERAVDPAVTRSTATTSWGAFLFSPQHSGYAEDAKAITTANAGSLTKAWSFTPPAAPIAGLDSGFLSSPTVVNGTIYIGSDNGTFYAVRESSGAVIWHDSIGYVDRGTCQQLGFTSTATVASDPVTHALTVYVEGPNGYLYALNASNGKVVWRATVGVPFPLRNDYYAWSSPTVSGGIVYLGISSQCDDPLVRGGVLAFNQHTGAITGSYYDIPTGALGGSVWSSIGVAPSGTVFVTTGNGPQSDQTLGQSESVIALKPKTLAFISSWQAPATLTGDLDFGASPTVWNAVLPGETTSTALVGAMNKAGIFYVFKQDDLAAGPVWSLDTAPPGTSNEQNESATASAAYNGKDVFVASSTTVIKNVTYPASIREVNPATGAVIWATGLSSVVQSSATLNGSGVLSIATYDPKSGATNGDYLINAATGAIITEIKDEGGLEFATPVYSGPYLLLATEEGLTAYKAP